MSPLTFVMPKSTAVLVYPTIFFWIVVLGDRQRRNLGSKWRL
jgi:hypothetical protein